MNVNAAGRVPPHHLMRAPQRPAPGATAGGSAAPTAPQTDTGPVAGGEVEASAGDPAGPTTPGGNDTPFTHALHRGQGRKLGILRRMPSAEDVAAEQAASGLGATDGTDTSVTDELAPVGDTTPAVDPGLADGTATAPGAAEPAEPIEPADPTDGTIAVDGTTLVDDLLGGDGQGESVVTGTLETIEQLRERLEAARTDGLWTLPVEGPDTTEV